MSDNISNQHGTYIRFDFQRNVSVCASIITAVNGH